MTQEVDIDRLGEYALIFIALYDAMKSQEHARVGAVSESIAHLARQKELASRSDKDGVVRKSN